MQQDKATKQAAAAQKKAQDAEKRAILKAANEANNILDAFAPFKKYDRNGVDLVIDFIRAEQLSRDQLDWAFLLLKVNMQNFYERAIGWKEGKKKAELRDSDARYLWACQRGSGAPVAYIHFRFTQEDERLCLYVYELQLDASLHRKGVGRFLMQTCELIARKHKMQWVMLTVFKENKAARQFYEALKYTIDETSPEKCDPSTPCSYDIMSKKLS